jgi:hypothetical protein
MFVKVKRTGVEWEVPDGSPAAIRILASLDDYEILDGIDKIDSNTIIGGSDESVRELIKKKDATKKGSK